jgi:hypothetical protein
MVFGVAMFIMPQYCKAEMHTSALSGRAWLDELLTGHPDRIYSHGQIIGRTPYLEIPIKSSPFHNF